jgi:hypothetical protein
MMHDESTLIYVTHERMIEFLRVSVYTYMYMRACKHAVHYVPISLWAGAPKSGGAQGYHHYHSTFVHSP